MRKINPELCPREDARENPALSHGPVHVAFSMSRDADDTRLRHWHIDGYLRSRVVGKIDGSGLGRGNGGGGDDDDDDDGEDSRLASGRPRGRIGNRGRRRR